MADPRGRASLFHLNEGLFQTHSDKLTHFTQSHSFVAASGSNVISWIQSNASDIVTVTLMLGDFGQKYSYCFFLGKTPKTLE